MSNKNKIVHHVYNRGRVQSLGFQNIDGKDATLGVMQPGEYDFGVAKTKETIYVIDGGMITEESGGHCLTRPTNDPIIFRKGQRIKISCDSPVAYLCVYARRKRQ